MKWEPFLHKQVFIRTVTYHYTGLLSDERDGLLILHDAAWIPNSGRFSDALQSCRFLEVEPFPNQVGINADTVVDITTIKKLPLRQR